MYPTIADKAIEYMKENSGSTVRAKGSNWTKKEGQQNHVIFGIIK